ncbi:MAG: DUF3310 domain-containing protein [Candidatus Freyarchaeota archaeon]
MTEEVHHPRHYNMGKTEVIDVIKDQLPSAGFIGFLQGTVLQYLLRFPYKGKPKLDLQKARWYLDKLIEEVGEQSR